jgi:hypothetical protein
VLSQLAQEAHDAIAAEDQAVERRLRKAVDTSGRCAAHVLEKVIHQKAVRAEALTAELEALRREVAGGARALHDAVRKYGWPPPRLSAAAVRVVAGNSGEGGYARGPHFSPHCGGIPNSDRSRTRLKSRPHKTTSFW